MKKLLNEILRLKTPIVLLASWLIVWGWKESLMTASLLTGFIAISMILAHIVSKELFRGYKWDVGARLNEAWEKQRLNKSILAVGMLLARVLIYIAIVIAMALILTLLRGSAFGSPSPSRPSPFQIETLKQEHDLIWPDSDIYILMGQINAESAWRESAIRTESSGVTSYGLMQVLDSTFNELKKKNQTLADIEPVQMLQARYGIRTGILYDIQMWKLCQFADIKVEDMKNANLHGDRLSSIIPFNRWAFTLASYNGGYGNILKDRKLTAIKGYDRNIWFGNVELFSNRSAGNFRINREYPVKAFRYAGVYRRVY